MATVREWFADFVQALVERSGRNDWPDPASEYWADWERELVRQGVRWPEADAASSRACSTPNLFIADYRPTVLAEVRKIRAEAPAGPAGSPEDARLASRDCPDCGGNGLATRHVHAEILGRFKAASGGDVPLGAAVSLPCSCPLGHHLARGLAPEGRPPPPTVDEYPSLRRRPVPWDAPTADRLDNRYRHRPDEWDDVHGCPIPGEAGDLAGLRALTAASKAPTSPATRRSQLEAVDRAFPREIAPRVKPGPLAVSIPEDDAADGWY